MSGRIKFRPLKYCRISIDKTARLVLKSSFTMGVKQVWSSHLETRLLLEPNSRMSINGGFSMYCLKGDPFYDPDSNKIFIETFKKHLNSQITVKEIDAHINEPVFAEKAVSALMEIIEPLKSA